MDETRILQLEIYKKNFIRAYNENDYKLIKVYYDLLLNIIRDQESDLSQKRKIIRKQQLMIQRRDDIIQDLKR